MNLANALTRHVKTQLLKQQRFESGEVIGICEALVDMVHLPQALRFRKEWIQIFDAMTEVLLHAVRSEDHIVGDMRVISPDTCRCLELILAAERRSTHQVLAKYDDWVAWYTPEKSVFGDEFVDALDSQCIDTRIAYPTWREQRRRDMGQS